MKKITTLFLITVMLLGTSGCMTELPKAAEEKTKEVSIEVKPTIPYADRLFIYSNGLDVEYKQLEEEDKSKTKKYIYYPIISGLKNKEIQSKLNKEIPAELEGMLTQLQTMYPEGGDQVKKYESKYIYAEIVYNFNNVVFIDYNVSIAATFKEKYDKSFNTYMSVGYDLVTGDRIKLADLFKPGTDYRSKINSFIGQYLIENNFDDYEYEMMTKPFQGIRESQSFSLSFEGLRIALDEKNDEFVFNGYTPTIDIPFEYLGDDLYLFDRYFDKDRNIYESDKLIKKLLPNEIRFVPQKYYGAGTDKWNISILQGEFINISDKVIEEKVSALLKPSIDAEAFKKKAEEYIAATNAEYYKDYIHDVYVMMNAGGYLSVVSEDYIYDSDTSELYKRVFNYDFSKKKEMRLADLFISYAAAAETIRKNIGKVKLQIPDAILEEGIKEALGSYDFSFNESEVIFRFPVKEANPDSIPEYIWISFEEFGLENISIFN